MKEMVQNLLNFFPCKNLYSRESFHWGHCIKRSCKTETAFLSYMNSDFIKLTCGAAKAMKKWLRRWGGWRHFNFPQHRISRDIEERKWVWKAKHYSTQGSPWGLIALSPLAGPSLLQGQGGTETPFEDAVSTSCTVGTLAHCWDFCFETKPGSLCASVDKVGAVNLWAGALHAQGTSYVPSAFDHLEIHSSYSKWSLGGSFSTLTAESGQLA